MEVAQKVVGIITMIEWIRTSRLSIKITLSLLLGGAHRCLPSCARGYGEHGVHGVGVGGGERGFITFKTSTSTNTGLYGGMQSSGRGNRTRALPVVLATAGQL